MIPDHLNKAHFGAVGSCIAVTTEDSLHVTLSINQRNSYGDVIVKALTKTLERSERLQETVPKDNFHSFGIMNIDDPQKNRFVRY